VRGLDDLQSTPAGRRLLADEMTFVDPVVFINSLKVPARQEEGSAPCRPVYVHQQVYLDYRASVVAKVALLRTLSDLASDLRPDFLWIDTDRAGSDKLSLRLYLAGRQGGVPVRLAPPGCEPCEPRFIATDPGRLADAADRMERIIRSAPEASGVRLSRFERLRPLIAAGGTLAELSRRLTDFLFDETMAFRPCPALVSELAAAGALQPALDMLLNRLPAFIARFNERIAALQALDIDPHVRPLAEDYLPLFMSSPADDRRLRLRLVRDGGVQLACATDQDGKSYRYELGKGDVSVAALDGQVRWSPDVTLPVLVNDRYSGMVGGKSSALYMLVLRATMLKVLDMTPVPLLVPTAWNVFGGAFDSLLEAYLDGRSV
jgi:hypothetical protein